MELVSQDGDGVGAGAGAGVGDGAGEGVGEGEGVGGVCGQREGSGIFPYRSSKIRRFQYRLSRYTFVYLDR